MVGYLITDSRTTKMNQSKTEIVRVLYYLKKFDLYDLDSITKTFSTHLTVHLAMDNFKLSVLRNKVLLYFLVVPL